MYKTVDGGMHWTKLDTGSYSDFTELFFVSPRVGYVVGSGAMLLTVDGGTTWKEMTGGYGGWVNSVFFTDEKTGYAVGSEGSIMKTTNGQYVPVKRIMPELSAFSLYPNPAGQLVTITCNVPEKGGFRVSIYDLHGQCMLKETFEQGGQALMHTGSLCSGVYIARIESNTGTESRKLVIE